MLRAMRSAPVCHSVRAAPERGLRGSAWSRPERGVAVATRSGSAPAPLPLSGAALTEHTEGGYRLRDVKEGLYMQCAVAVYRPSQALDRASLEP